MGESEADFPRLLESIPLPDGVTQEQWTEEKTHWQNPRIRALLGCSGMLETVYESNQAILNCSPDRLAEIWATVREVSRLIGDEVVPLLDGASVIPKLEEARRRTQMSGRILAATVVEEIDRMPEKVFRHLQKVFVARKPLKISRVK